MRLSSSKVESPNSEAHSRSPSSNARPCTLRWPHDHTGDAASGCPGAASPSGVIRRILPAERVAVLGQLRRGRSRRWRRRACRPGRTRAGRRRGSKPFGMPASTTSGSPRPPEASASSRSRADDAVVLGRRDVEVEEPVDVVRRRHGHTEQAALALGGRGSSMLAELGSTAPSSRTAEDARAVALGDDRRPVGQEGDAPRDGEALGDGADDPRPARPGRVLGPLVGDGSSVASRSSEGVATTVVPPRSSSPEQATSRLPTVPSTSAAGSASQHPLEEVEQQGVDDVGLLHLHEVACRAARRTRLADPRRRRAHVAGSGQHVVGGADQERRDAPASRARRGVLGGARERGGSTSPAGVARNSCTAISASRRSRTGSMKPLCVSSVSAPHRRAAGGSAVRARGRRAASSGRASTVSGRATTWGTRRGASIVRERVAGDARDGQDGRDALGVQGGELEHRVDADRPARGRRRGRGRSGPAPRARPRRSPRCRRGPGRRARSDRRDAAVVPGDDADAAVGIEQGRPRPRADCRARCTAARSGRRSRRRGSLVQARSRVPSSESTSA